MVKTQILPDSHHPMENRAKVKKTLDWTRQNKPERIILLGDVLETHSLSTHRRLPQWEDNLIRELASGKRFLHELRAAAPKAEITYIVGNHERRWYNYIGGRVPAMRLLGIDLKDFLDIDRLGIRWHNDQDRGIRVATGQGQVAYCYHGDNLRRTTQHLGTAATMAKQLGQNIICGHTHKLKTVFTHCGKKAVWGMEAGCLVNIRHKAFRYAGLIPDWTHAFLVADSERTDSPLPQVYLP